MLDGIRPFRTEEIERTTSIVSKREVGDLLRHGLVCVNRLFIFVVAED